MLISCIRLASGRYGVRRRIILSLLSGLFVSAITTPPVLAQAAMPGHVVAAHPHDAHIAEASQRFGIPTTWIIAVMRTESAGDVRAISSAGAMGLMQVMPDTWADLRIRHALGRDPFEPRDNILAGTAYLREMWDRYGNVAAMLAAYNAGPGRYDEYRATARPLPAETRAYVAALTPILLGERPSGGSSSVVPPLDWREAAIFVAGEIGATASDPASPDPTPRDAPSFVPAAPETLTALQPEGLFVARSAGEDQP
ncbi:MULTISPECIES: lytic transglycosylase domain-containing protein [Alphaproteobacteria]|nr:MULTISPECIES: lytic transglycosylase domain-containing protein [Paracoccaceae]MCV0383092.1 lytic transglycosylase domain-containing protein [Erythrobacter sp.]MDP5305598.1 lytic transglycosylase domain-containing protein [Paracoccus sp. 2205BS29-5]SNR64448.1 Transglycosylase SLT domain-containing protein [Paracoccus sediminis]